MYCKAVLSTTVLPIDGQYEVTTLDIVPDISGVPHYIGHPDTKAIVESLGAVKPPSNIFFGLGIGETAIAFAIKQGRSTRATEGFTNPHQSISLADLSIREIKRIA